MNINIETYAKDTELSNINPTSNIQSNASTSLNDPPNNPIDIATTTLNNPQLQTVVTNDPTSSNTATNGTTRQDDVVMGTVSMPQVVNSSNASEGGETNNNVTIAESNASITIQPVSDGLAIELSDNSETQNTENAALFDTSQTKPLDSISSANPVTTTSQLSDNITNEYTTTKTAPENNGHNSYSHQNYHDNHN